MSAQDSEAPSHAAEGAEERLEQIFQRVEEESKRRALAAEQAEARATSRLSQTIPEETAEHIDASATPSPVTPAAATSARPVVGERRRGSVSVSRFGQAPTASTTGDAPRAETPAAAYTVNPGAFYAVQNHQHGSADSLASSAHGSPASPAAAEDEASVVQMATISGRQSLSRAFGRRLSRAKTPSRAGLNGMLIGVSVEEATVEHHPGDDDDELDEPAPAQPGDSNSPEGAKTDGEAEGQKKVGRARAASRSIIYAGDGPPPGSPLASRPGTSSGPPAAVEKDKGAELKVKAKGSRASMPEEAEAGAAARSERRWLIRAKDFTRRLKRKSMIALGAAR